MAQFDVFINPLPLARRAYPFVVAMQSDFSVTALDQLIAPIAAKEFPDTRSNRLTPLVEIDEAEHVVVVPRLTVIRTRELVEFVASLASARSQLLGAVDYLFFGV